LSQDIELEVDTAFSSEDRAAIHAAADKWNTVTRSGRKFIVSSSGDVLVLSAHVPGGYAGLEQSDWSLVRIDPDAPREDVYAIALHELGHVLGIRHTRSGVMWSPATGARRPEQWPPVEFNEEDIAACRRAWAC